MLLAPVISTLRALSRMVFQNDALYPHLTAAENMEFALRMAKVPKPERTRRVQEAAEVLGLSPYLGRKPKALSGGQQQRVAMGRAIVREPQVFCMDEPLSNLDAKMRMQTRTDIARLQTELGVTTVYVTHDQVEAMTLERLGSGSYVYGTTDLDGMSATIVARVAPRERIARGDTVYIAVDPGGVHLFDTTAGLRSARS